MPDPHGFSRWRKVVVESVLVIFWRKVIIHAALCFARKIAVSVDLSIGRVVQEWDRRGTFECDGELGVESAGMNSDL
jgi:hypothetical protein